MSEVKEKNYFETLNSLNVSEKVEKKNNLSYLSWAWAWGELKKIHPLAQYKVYEQADGKIYWSDSRTAWVKVGVTVNELEHIEYLPVMDFRNASITIDKITSFDVNKAIQRALTKAIARHGLGLYIYAGEDLPDNEDKKIETIPTSQQIAIVESIENAKDEETLKSLYINAIKKAKDLNDKESESMFVVAKDKRKKELTNVK